MADTQTQPTDQPTELQVVKTSRIRDFKDNHPRITKVLGLIAVFFAGVVATLFVKNRKSDDVETTEPAGEEVVLDSTTETFPVTEA